MEEVERLIKTSLAEIERLLSTRTVIGEPIKAGEVTLIPLISVGFGFGAGGGAGKGESVKKGEGVGGGTGGGAWIRPKALVIIDKEGVRVEPIKGGITSAIEKFGETIPQMMEKCMEKWEARKKEG